MANTDLNRVIQDRPVYVKQWAAKKALENLGKALSTFGGNFAPFVDGDYRMGDIVLLLRSDPKVTVELLQEFVCCARIDGKEILPETFNHYYNGKLLFIFSIFSFVCEVQYKDFFEQGLSLSESDPDPIENKT